MWSFLWFRSQEYISLERKVVEVHVQRLSKFSHARRTKSTTETSISTRVYILSLSTLFGVRLRPKHDPKQSLLGSRSEKGSDTKE